MKGMAKDYRALLRRKVDVRICSPSVCHIALAKPLDPGGASPAPLRLEEELIVIRQRIFKTGTTHRCGRDGECTAAKALRMTTVPYGRRKGYRGSTTDMRGLGGDKIDRERESVCKPLQLTGCTALAKGPSAAFHMVHCGTFVGGTGQRYKGV